MLHKKLLSPGGTGHVKYSTRGQKLLWIDVYWTAEKTSLVKMKWKVTFLQFPVSTVLLSQRWGWGREITPSVNTHPHYAIVPPLCPHHPRSVVKVLPVTSPSFHHSCHCTVTLLSLLLSCPWLLGFLDAINDTGGIYAFGWCSELGSVYTGRKPLLYYCPSPSGVHAVRLPLQVKGRQWISGRSVSKAGRVQTSPLICLPLGRITLPQKPLVIWRWRNIFITDCGFVSECVYVLERKWEGGREGAHGWHVLQIDMAKKCVEKM